MASVVTGGDSLVYKLKIGTDASFVLIYTSTGSTVPFEYIVSGNMLYFSDGAVARKWDGTWPDATNIHLTKWGIDFPVTPPNMGIFPSAPAGPVDISFWLKSAYAYGNSLTGHLSSPTNNPNPSNSFTNQNLGIVGNYSADPQVDKVHIYRTTDGGDGIYYEIGASPITNVPANVNTPGAAVYSAWPNPGSSTSSAVQLVTPSGTYNNGAVRPLSFSLIIDALQVGSTSATGTLTGAGAPQPGDTVTIGVFTYTFVTNLTGPGFQVKIQPFAGTAFSNLAAAINGSAGLGSLYSFAPVNPYVTAVASTNQVTVTAKATYSGTAGNSIATTLFSSLGALSWGSGTLQNGSDGADTFKWTEDFGVTYTTGVAITGASQSLAHGISVTFGALIGHALNDRWDFANWKVNSVSQDLGLTSNFVTAPSNSNNPPPPLLALEEFSNRIWGVTGSSTRFSGWEEIINGVEEECFPTNNSFNLANEQTGIKKAGDGLLLLTASGTEKVTGNSIATFRKDPLFSRVGTRQQATIVPVGSSIAFLDNSGMMRITDGFSQSEISKSIRSDLSGIDPTKASVAFHKDARRQLLLLLDGNAGKVRVLDLDLDMWMVPWTVGGGAIASVETSPGIWTLLLAHSSGIVLKNDFTTCSDNNATYSPAMTTQLIGLTSGQNPVDVAGDVADLEYFSIQTGSVVPLTVQYLVDDDPSLDPHTGTVNTTAIGGVFTVTQVTGDKFQTGNIAAGNPITINSVVYTILSVTDDQHLLLTTSAGNQNNKTYSASPFKDVTSTKTTSPLRVQGTALLENWYYARTPGARSASLKLTWANSSVNFKLFGWDMASWKMEQ